MHAQLGLIMDNMIQKDQKTPPPLPHDAAHNITKGEDSLQPSP